MEKFRITDINHPDFARAWELYKQTFPVEERRLIGDQSLIMSLPNYHFEIIFQDSCFLGILFWWEFVDLRYIEHFATLPICRGKGYGKEILEEFKNRDTRPLVLEVELPDEAIKQRRIQFYKRIGFHLTDHFYQQPPYREGDLPVQFLLMSYPVSISAEDVYHFIKDYHPIIYQVN